MKKNYTQPTYFLVVDDVTINSNIIEECFVCDIDKCKGACCTLEDAYGAPLTLEETETLNKIYPVVKKYLSKINQDIIEKFGLFEEIYGGYNTQTVEEKDCVFVYLENDNAKCAIEKAYFNGEIKFRKPISCHLFPIRRNKFASDILKGDLLRICEPALEKGLELNVPIYEFCKESLIQLYGKRWYNKLLKEIKKIKK